jgi:predicted nucleic acid-binding protein
MRLIVDTNIVFSAILNSNSRIGELLIKSKDYFSLFSVNQLKIELHRYKEKVIRIANYTDEEYTEAKELAVSKIRFIRDSLIPKQDLFAAEELLYDNDLDDTVFLALSIHLNAKLWTGDQELISGLEKKGYYNTITTKELFNIYLNKETSEK